MLSDSLNGFRELQHFPMLALAASKSGRLDLQLTERWAWANDLPRGYRWALRADVERLMTGAVAPLTEYYAGKGGWRGCSYGGRERRCFLFADSLEVGGCLQAAEDEGVFDKDHPTAAQLRATMPSNFFAGIVLIIDEDLD